MTPSTIKSRPVYAGLRAVPSARRNLVAFQGQGAAAVLRMLREAPAGFAERTHLLYADHEEPGEQGREHLRALGTDRVDLFPGADEVLHALDGLLATATMGTRLYAAGTEGFVGRVVCLAIDHGIDHHSVLTEHSGSLARRVQCVHCKHITEDVTVSVFECAGCGVLLFVRDHYSRRLAAFQGVAASAEDPNERPSAQEMYP
jgi:dimethylamine monooxygenase subunit C